MDLPDLRAKIKVDTSGLLEAEAKLKVLGESAKTALESWRSDQLAKYADQAATAFVKFGSAGEIASLRIRSATANTRADLDKLELRTRTFANGLETDFRRGASAMIKLGEDGAVALTSFASDVEQVGQATSRVIPVLTGLGAAATQVGTSFGALGPALGGALGGLVTGAVIALAPFIATVVVITTAITTLVATAVAGFAAVGTAIALTLGPIGLLAFGAYQLTQRLVNAGTVADPFARLKQHVSDAADALGLKALPAMKAIAPVLDNMVPAVQSAGEQMLQWFGDKLPKILPVVSDLTHRMSDAFNEGFPVVRNFLGQMIDRLPALGPIFSQAMSGAIEAVKGLSTNLIRFVDWFQKEWPTLEPIVKQVMDQAGKAVQNFGAEAEKLVNWFIENWPEIQHNIQNLLPVLKFLGDAVQKVADIFVAFMRGEEVIVGWLSRVGDAMSGLGRIAQTVAGYVQSLWDTIARQPSTSINLAGGFVPGAAPGIPNAGRQFGGPVLPNSIYRVGEAGPETLVMYPGGGGYVIPTTTNNRQIGPFYITGYNGTMDEHELAATMRRYERLYG